MNAEKNLRLKRKILFETGRSKRKFYNHEHCIICKNVLSVIYNWFIVKLIMLKIELVSCSILKLCFNLVATEQLFFAMVEQNQLKRKKASSFELGFFIIKRSFHSGIVFC